MGVIKKEDFVVTSNMVKCLLGGWYTWWKRGVIIWIRNISCLASAVMIGFYIILRGEELFITSLRVMLKFWEETRLRNEEYHIMVTLKVMFKGETAEKLNMLPLVDIKDSGIEVIRWVVIWLEVLVEKESRLEG